MTYSIYNTSSSATYTITDGTVNIDTDIGLVGKGYLGYGPTVNRNFLQLLENFSGSTAPTKPIKGQLWYDSLNQAVKVYNGTTFSAISGSSLSATNLTVSGDLSVSGAASFYGTVTLPALSGLTVNGTANITNVRGALGGPFNGTVGAITPNTGAFTTLSASTNILVGTLGIWAGNATITGVTLSGVSAGATGTLNGPHNGTVGGVTPNSGVFTTLTATTSYNGAMNGAHNGTVGATTANTGAFTTLSASTSVTAGSIQLWAGNNTITGATISGMSGGATGTLAGPFNGTVGAITPNTGAFTSVTTGTLTATSGYQGAASGPLNGTIGATTANTGAFTTLSASTSIVVGTLGIWAGNATITGVTLSGVSAGATGTLNGPLNGTVGGITPNTGAFTTISVNSSTAGITNAASSGTGNIGSTGSTFNTVFAKATTAQYADLAENYEADVAYAPGTVLDFGGEFDVTLSNTTSSSRVAGVVSTNPAYLMNSHAEGNFIVALALTGRVPCKVRGAVSKGDLLVSAGEGYAMTDNNARAGTIIGKAVQNNEGGDNVIDIVVGRF